MHRLPHLQSRGRKDIRASRSRWFALQQGEVSLITHPAPVTRAASVHTRRIQCVRKFFGVMCLSAPWAPAPGVSRKALLSTRFVFISGREKLAS